MRVEVVKESDVPKAKEKFSKIMSEHLYSVHKPLADLELLASSGSGDINYSAIKCDACKERSDEEMQLLRWGTAAKKAMENTTNSKSTNSMNPSKTERNSMTAKKNGFNNLFNMAGRSKSPEKPKSSFQERDRDSMKKDNLWKKKDSVKNKDSTEKDQALMEETKELIEKEKDTVEKDKNFVQKDKDSAEKTKNSTEKNKGSKTTSTAKKVSPQSNSVKKGSLNNFFGKLTSPSKSIEVTSSEKKNHNAKEEFTEEKMSKEKKKLQGKKRNRSKETDEGAKKRKRIVIQNDSSDSEVQSDIEMEELVPETEPEILAKPKSPSPPRIKHENGKRKVLKLVNKTYKEGEYIVTKKEHVYVSCSEDEEEKEEEMRRKEKKAEAKIEKVKKKQSTLTDFFKRS
ncbi:uncharacterized protein [Temnothorax longispinosus]